MCLQDVKIGRSLSSRSNSETLVANAPTTMMSANGARRGITVTLVSDGGDAAKMVEITIAQGSEPIGIGSVNRAFPFFHREIDTTAIELTGAIIANDNNTAAAAQAIVRVTEHYSTQDLEQVVK